MQFYEWSKFCAAVNLAKFLPSHLLELPGASSPAVGWSSLGW